ncbi:hypothetical protein [Streptomyces sp. SD15]
MRSLPLPLTLTARLLPVAVLASAGWALTSGPLAATPTAAEPKTPQKTKTATAPSTSAATKTYTSSPAPCTAVATKSITSLVPGAKTAGQEIASTDKTVRRTCSWNALKGYDYRWLDVSYEIKESDKEAQSSFKGRTTDKGDGASVSGLGNEAYSASKLTTEDKQETRETVLTVRASNAIVVITYNGSDFETKKAPKADVVFDGALKAATEAVATLGKSAQ